MLSHKNFTNMISMLSAWLDMDITDGVFVGAADASHGLIFRQAS